MLTAPGYTIPVSISTENYDSIRMDMLLLVMTKQHIKPFLPNNNTMSDGMSEVNQNGNLP